MSPATGARSGFNGEEPTTEADVVSSEELRVEPIEESSEKSAVETNRDVKETISYIRSAGMQQSVDVSEPILDDFSGEVDHATEVSSHEQEISDLFDIKQFAGLGSITKITKKKIKKRDKRGGMSSISHDVVSQIPVALQNIYPFGFVLPGGQSLAEVLLDNKLYDDTWLRAIYPLALRDEHPIYPSTLIRLHSVPVSFGGKRSSIKNQRWTAYECFKLDGNVERILDGSTIFPPGMLLRRLDRYDLMQYPVSGPHLCLVGIDTIRPVWQSFTDTSDEGTALEVQALDPRRVSDGMILALRGQYDTVERTALEYSRQVRRYLRSLEFHKDTIETDLHNLLKEEHSHSE